MTAPARLLLLGTPTLTRGEQAWVLPLERRSQLLVLLALAGAWVSRREVAAALWPEVPGAQASTHLRKTLFRLPSVPWGDCVRAEGGALRFDGETDVAAFEAALRASRIDEALALWRGEPLAGFDGDSQPLWSERLQHERERLRWAWRGAALAWLQAEVPAPAAVALSARLLETDPWDEAALQQHLRWLRRCGQHDAARQVHARFVERVRAELGVAPSAELMALADGGGTVAQAAQEAPEAAPVRLLSPPGAAIDAGLVGRGAELREIASLLEADEDRLVTLIGPGGVGKTRLARRALQELAPGFADGAVFLPLEDLDDAGGIAARLARELGLTPEGGDADAPLREHLRARRMLVVLDNFEHLARGGAGLVEAWLQHAAGLKLLVTSRVRLGLAREQLLPLEGLPCPEPEDADRIDAFDASQLFVRQARRVAPGLRPAAEALAIVEICRLVDGLPLALELAAAWTRVLPCDVIAAELRQGTGLLRAGGVEHGARHASIERVFDQSWQLLTMAERDALARLSVFVGSFTPQAARAVAAAPLPVLGALADKSLLRRDGPRVQLHPLVQQLAAVRLADAGADAAAAAAHADCFHGLLARLGTALHHGDRDALQQLDLEFENCRAAWRWSTDCGDAAALARSAAPLADWSDHRGRVPEALDLLQQALAAPALRDRGDHLAPLHAVTAHLTYRQDRYGDAQALARRALDLACREGDDDSQLAALNTLGCCALRLGSLDEAARHFEEHLRRSPASTDPSRAARTLGNLAIVEKAVGRFDLALSHYCEALLLEQQLGDVSAEVSCLQNLALLHLSLGELDAGAARLNRALALCDRHGFAVSRAAVLGALVDHARLSGDFDAAHRHATAAMAPAQALGLRGLACGLMVDFVHIALHRNDVTEARRAVSEAAAMALALGRPALQLSVVNVFAEILATTGALRAALHLLDLVAAHPATSPPERQTLIERAQAWESRLAESGAPPVQQTPSSPALTLDELLRRIAAEGGIEHGPLRDRLRGAA